MVREFQKIIGSETREQILKKEKRLPDILLACVGGGSNAIGLFHPFYKDKSVRFIGVEAYGAASLNYGGPGILHGTLSYILQTRTGQIEETHSVAPGLDYPGVGPEHAFYKENGRAQYVTVKDEEALSAFLFLTRMEGIIPALESSHALAYLKKIAKIKKGQIAVVSLSGRGDKDLETVLKKSKGVVHV